MVEIIAAVDGKPEHRSTLISVELGNWSGISCDGASEQDCEGSCNCARSK
jgi:hypothetical protein